MIVCGGFVIRIVGFFLFLREFGVLFTGKGRFVVGIV